MESSPERRLRALLCPVCGDGLARLERGVGCENGHRYDRARSGYVNLMTGRPSRFREDKAEQVAARHRVLASGAYSALSDALAQASVSALDAAASRPRSAESTRRVARGLNPLLLDSGAGTGHHAGVVATALREAGLQPETLAMDLSTHALRHAARRQDTTAIVWDTWRAWPVAARSVDILLDVFSPRNIEEFSRVLRLGGTAIVAVPHPDHLAQLRPLGALGIETGKHERLLSDVAGDFELVARREVRHRIALDASLAVDLLLMGPAGHHATAEDLAERSRATPVAGATLHVEVFTFRRRGHEADHPRE